LAQCRFPRLAISNAEMLIFFSKKICGSNFIKRHSETVMVCNYQNVDCLLRKKNYCVIYYNFQHTFVPYEPVFIGVLARLSLSVRSLAYLKNRTSKLHEIFCQRRPLLWLRHQLTTMRYVMHFRFCGRRLLAVIISFSLCLSEFNMPRRLHPASV